MDKGHVFVRENCGSFADNGLLGSVQDFVTQAIIYASDNGAVAGLRIRASPDIAERIVNVPGKIPTTRDYDMPYGTIRIFHNDVLRAELWGWTA